MTDQLRGDDQSSHDRESATQRELGAQDRVDEPRNAADEVPVPIVMSPAEVDERAQVVEALNAEAGETQPGPEGEGNR